MAMLSKGEEELERINNERLLLMQQTSLHKTEVEHTYDIRGKGHYSLTYEIH